MKAPSINDLKEIFPERIKLLAKVIARKPEVYTPKWASTIDLTFSHYTNTSTINMLQCINTGLMECDWPFPGFINLEREKKEYMADWGLLTEKNRLRYIKSIGARLSRGLSVGMIAFIGQQKKGEDQIRFCDFWMCRNFNRHRADIFSYLYLHPLLTDKRMLVTDIKRAYRYGLWSACISTAFPVLDAVLRDYFKTDSLHVPLTKLRKAFQGAGLKPADLMPGFCVADIYKDPKYRNDLAKSVDEDLRLIGIYLSSFFHYTEKYYEDFDNAASIPLSVLNRHAVIHCALSYGTKANATRVLTFLDLALRLEKPLRILITGNMSSDYSQPQAASPPD